MKGNRTRVAVIGCGPHTQKTHLPFFADNKDDVVLVMAVEVIGKGEQVRDRLGAGNDQIEIIEVEPWDGSTMPPATADKLDKAAKRLDVDAIIVATQPLAHSAYLQWGLRIAPVFVDKPIILHKDSANDADVARSLESDLHTVVDALALYPDNFVAVGTQRRYHVPLEMLRGLALDAAERFQTPVTFMTSSHADGQFRLPHEVQSFRYHGYDEGYGKLGHSGFHEIAFQADVFRDTCAAAGFTYDGFTTTASAIRPGGFLKTTPRSTYEQRWGAKEWEITSPLDHDILAERMQRYGELDVAVTNTFYSERTAVALGQINLSHNSVSRRSTLASNADLYKGNGRTKHESHVVQVGPFFTGQLHSYQSRSNHDLNGENERGLGGNDSAELHIYRNADWYPPGTPAFEILTGDRIAEIGGLSTGTTFTGDAKVKMLADFFDVINRKKPVSEHRSLLQSHLFGGSLLSAAYESVATGSTVCRRIDASVFGGLR